MISANYKNTFILYIIWFCYLSFYKKASVIKKKKKKMFTKKNGE